LPILAIVICDWRIDGQNSFMLSLESARQQILSRLTPLPAESIPVSQAYGRFLTQNVTASIDLPPFDNSAMDGYAVRSNDVAGATPERSIALQLAGRSAAGESTMPPVEPGTCLRVFTGAPLPSGADAVVMQEDTRIDPGDPRRIWISDAVKPWENVRFKGEDVKCASHVLSTGERMSAAHLGLVSALGIGAIHVARRPRIALLSTGNELIEPGTKLEPGRIYESNRTMLAPLLERSGAIVRALPLVPDTLAATAEALTKAFEENDAVVSSGGVSVGELDFVKAAFEGLGGRLEFWRIAMKPGKPFAFGTLGQKYFFGLPGNPVSALVTFLLLVRPTLYRWQGASHTDPPQRRVVAADVFENRGERRHFMRARLDESGQAKLAGSQASHMLGALAGADGLIDVPPAWTVSPGNEALFIEFED
jgi:molybdopterin molybdotransferase